MEEIPNVRELTFETGYGKKGWWFQYGRWDLRMYCPKCGLREAFMMTINLVADDGTITDPGVCGKCGFSGPLRLMGFNQEALNAADANEKRYASLGASDISTNWRHASDLKIYDRVIPNQESNNA